ncbi:DUF2971 domain-containing protein [Priestia megaterium]
MNISDIRNIEELNQCLENLGGRQKRVFENLKVNGNKKILYHYTSIYGLEGILKNGEFWVSHSDFLNDKTELKYTYELCKEIIKEITNHDEELHRDVLNLFNDAYHKHDELETFLLSLTTNGDSNLLWSNYSHNDGYSIAFKYPDSVNSIRRSITGENFVVFPGAVVYEKETQKQFLKEQLQIMVELYNLLSRGISEDLSVAISEKLIDRTTSIKLYSLFFKDSCFEQEEEFRVAFIGKHRDATQEGFRVSNGAFIPYIKAPFAENKEVIESITIGPKNKMDIAKEGLSKFLDHHGYGDLKQENIKKSRIPYRY